MWQRQALLKNSTTWETFLKVLMKLHQVEVQQLHASAALRVVLSSLYQQAEKICCKTFPSCHKTKLSTAASSFDCSSTSWADITSPRPLAFGKSFMKLLSLMRAAELWSWWWSKERKKEPKKERNESKMLRILYTRVFDSSISRAKALHIIQSFAL